MTTPNLQDIRRLQQLAARANAALTCIASDGVGGNSHGGQIKDLQGTISNALMDIEMAAEVVREIRRSVK
jgi:hypothetical protein